jgi:RNA polymerase sigma-70 factor (ECF subfamily)
MGVNATPHSNEDSRDEVSVGTLGALLYVDKDKWRVSEEEWVGLIQAIASGDQPSLQALYERAHRPVFTLIMRITNNRSTAEELTLDVFHDVWRRAAGFDAVGGSVLGWIMNQARSRAIDRVRFEQRKKRVNPHPKDDSVAVDSSEIVDEREQVRLREALSVLTPEEREAIETAFFAELTYAEVAARLNQPLGTIKTRIRSALAKLRHALAAGAEP